MKINFIEINIYFIPDPFSPIIHIRDERLTERLILFNNIGLSFE